MVLRHSWQFFSEESAANSVHCPDKHKQYRRDGQIAFGRRRGGAPVRSLDIVATRPR